MKITDYIPFIKKQFEYIRNQYKMKWKINDNEYIITLENDIALLSFTTFFREEGANFTVTDKKTNNYYTLSELIDIKTENNNHLTNSDKIKCKSFNDKIKVIIYISSIIIKKHCQDLLSGDFSQVGAGNSN